MPSITEIAGEVIAKWKRDLTQVVKWERMQADIEQAIRNERERCAKIADLWGESHTCDNHDTDPCCHVRTGARIAEKIRNGDSNV